MRLYRNEQGVIIKEHELRNWLFTEELNDIDSNKEDYLNGDMDLLSQFDCVNYARNASIDAVVDRLNASWGYNISSLDIEDELVFYMGMIISKKLKLEDKFILLDLYYNEIKTNLVRLYFDRGFDKSTKSLLQCVEDFVNEWGNYIVGRLYENGIVERVK